MSTPPDPTIYELRSSLYRKRLERIGNWGTARGAGADEELSLSSLVPLLTGSAYRGDGDSTADGSGNSRKNVRAPSMYPGKFLSESNQ